MSDTLAKLQELTASLNERDEELHKERECLRRKNLEYEVALEELRSTNSSLQEYLKELERAHQLIDIERQNLVNLFNKMHDMIFVVDLEGYILSLNDAVRNRLGYPNGDLIGKPITIVHLIHDLEEIKNIAKEALIKRLDICNISLISAQEEIIPVHTYIVDGLWNGNRVVFSVSREVGSLCKPTM